VRRGRLTAASATCESGTATPANPHVVRVADRVELVGALGLAGRLGHARDLMAVGERQAHRRATEAGVGAEPPDAEEELRDPRVHR